MVEGARLESVCTVILYREFESLTLRHLFLQKCAYVRMIFVAFFRSGCSAQVLRNCVS